MDVFYSVPAGATGKSVPLRIVLYTDENATEVLLIYEFFKFRLATPDPQVFDIPELAVCQTQHEPLIPQMTSSFHAKMEVKDTVHGEGGFESPIYDLKIHLEEDLKPG